ncbi:uncharacterized protein M421DRAFT_416734 [Didymella exigua CBS 183.55]|uniref:2EXR domain-containing protein n=1 Tax=Didymella exigua CBS 183.55 TaxID=1150837 RepID=A0A6A5S0J2_9PLEO|nr:uncharacterized protein M421DRAFT_416734 [Didymella exigua CBS 183.55]KAF1932006.1 hypothetical protein M421DRAFT_416734 [Didymella exigua CBS 183.55]
MLTANSFKRRKLAHTTFTKSEQALRLLPDGLLDATPRTEHCVSISIRNSRESPLLRLPAELRIKIWAYLLAYRHVLKQFPSRWRPGSGSSASTIRLDILRVCRQTYTETALLPFTLNSFTFITPCDMKATIDCSRLGHRNAIRKIALWCSCRGVRCHVSNYPLVLLPGLESVLVICRQMADPGRDPLNQAIIAEHIRALTCKRGISVSFT